MYIKNFLNFKPKFIPTIDTDFDGYLDLLYLKEIPSGLIFNNNGSIYLNLKKLPETTFNNNGSVIIRSLKELPEYVIFNNTGKIKFDSLNFARLSYDRFKFIYSKLEENKKIELKDYWYSKEYWNDIGKEYFYKNINRIYNEIIKSDNPFKALNNLKYKYPNISKKFLKKGDKLSLADQLGDLGFQ